jgi:hypothetical protein
MPKKEKEKYWWASPHLRLRPLTKYFPRRGSNAAAAAAARAAQQQQQQQQQ